jgi:hypothetical protein
LTTTGASAGDDDFGAVGLGAVGLGAVGLALGGAVGGAVGGAEAAGAAGTAAGAVVAILPTAGLKAATAIVAPITQIIVGRLFNMAGS